MGGWWCWLGGFCDRRSPTSGMLRIMSLLHISVEQHFISKKGFAFFSLHQTGLSGGKSCALCMHLVVEVVLVVLVVGGGSHLGWVGWIGVGHMSKGGGFYHIIGFCLICFRSFFFIGTILLSLKQV